MTYIILLILAHYIGDYALQNSYIAAFKSKDNYVLFAHCAIWTFVMTVVSNWIGLVDIHSSSDIIIVVFVLLIPHIIIDYIKGYQRLWCSSSFCEKVGLTGEHTLYIDQFLHLVQIIVFVIILS